MIRWRRRRRQRTDGIAESAARYGVVYVPVSKTLLPKLAAWSEPVSIRIVRSSPHLAELEVRRVDADAGAAS